MAQPMSSNSISTRRFNAAAISGLFPPRCLTFEEKYYKIVPG